MYDGNARLLGIAAVHHHGRQSLASIQAILNSDGKDVDALLPGLGSDWDHVDVVEPWQPSGPDCFDLSGYNCQSGRSRIKSGRGNYIPNFTSAASGWNRRPRAFRLWYHSRPAPDSILGFSRSGRRADLYHTSCNPPTDAGRTGSPDVGRKSCAR